MEIKLVMFIDSATSKDCTYTVMVMCIDSSASKDYSILWKLYW